MANQVASYGWTLWLIIGGMAAVTYLNRAGLFLLPERFVLPPALERALKYAPASALAAIVVPDLFMRGGALDLSLSNAHLYAGAAGFVAALLSRQTLAGIAVGMLTLHSMERLL